MAEVINCSVQTDSRSERIRIIIRAAGKYLEIERIMVKQINEILNIQASNS